MFIQCSTTLDHLTIDRAVDEPDGEDDELTEAQRVIPEHWRLERPADIDELVDDGDRAQETRLLRRPSGVR